MFWSKSQTEEITREYQEWLGRGGEGWGGGLLVERKSMLEK